MKKLIKEVLTKQQNRKYRSCLGKKRESYSEWLGRFQNVWAEEAKNVLARLGEECAEQDVVFLQLCEGEVLPGAKLCIRAFLAEHRATDIVYADEDVRTRVLQENTASDGGENPWFKPDWSPDLLECSFYFGGFIGMRKQAFEELRQICMGSKDVDEIFAVVAENHYRVTDVDLFEECLHAWIDAKKLAHRHDGVGHCPQILFRAKDSEAQERFLRKSSFLEACEEQSLQAIGSESLLSIVIPSKDNPKLLAQCLKSIGPALDFLNNGQNSGQENRQLPAEVLIVDNGSSAENKQKIEKLLETQELPTQYIYEPMNFNFSVMCNLGASKAKGNLLLFLNDDVVLTESCLIPMAAKALKAATGAVGIKLLYPDNGRIQHAGITNLPMGPVHKLQFQEDEKAYYFHTNKTNRNYLAVTAACLMVEKDKFDQVGGFAEELKVAFNDVDLCFALYEAGYFNVCVNEAYAYHHESVSRGSDEAEEKLQRLLEERARLYERHPGLDGADPYYSVHLSTEGLDTGIRPAYETSGNETQRGMFAAADSLPQGCRQDNCLMVRVESFTDGVLTGYGIVLGDNNACYRRDMYLKNEKEGTYFMLRLDGQYRPDLEENLADQSNVALCGYRVKVGKIPAGRYRVCMVAGNRLNGLKLYNETNRVIEIKESIGH